MKKINYLLLFANYLFLSPSFAQTAQCGSIPTFTLEQLSPFAGPQPVPTGTTYLNDSSCSPSYSESSIEDGITVVIPNTNNAICRLNDGKELPCE